MNKQQVFVSISGVSGSSTNPSHLEEIEAISYSMGMSRAGLAGRGAGVRRLNPEDFSFKISAGSHETTRLVNAHFLKQLLKEIVITVEAMNEAGNIVNTILLIKLENCMITSMRIEPAEDGDAINNFSVACERSKMSFYPGQKKSSEIVESSGF